MNYSTEMVPQLITGVTDIKESSKQNLPGTHWPQWGLGITHARSSQTVQWDHCYNKQTLPIIHRSSKQASTL